jgi:hypothetical protein
MIAMAVLVIGSATTAIAQETRGLPGPPIADYDQVLAALEAGAEQARANRAVSGLPRIMVAGYWPPTNDMIRHLSDNPAQNPTWEGGNWEGRGYDIYAFFPEFPSGPAAGCNWGKGVGDFEVDYQDTSSDWWAIVEQIDPVAILTFSRGSAGIKWEIEYVQRNLTTWFPDYETPTQPNPAPPDASVEAGFTRCSSLPIQSVIDAVLAVEPGMEVFLDVNGFGGGFLSEFMAYHGVWSRGIHAYSDDVNQVLGAGHIHVGWDSGPSGDCEMDLVPLRNALDSTLHAYIDYLDEYPTQLVGDRCPESCMTTQTGISAFVTPPTHNIDCTLSDQTCVTGETSIIPMSCRNNESFEVTLHWQLSNDNVNCDFDETVDVSFPDAGFQNCSDFGSCGDGGVPGTSCGCLGGGTVVIPPNGGNGEFMVEVACPSWSPLDYECPADACCDCMQAMEDGCAANSSNDAEAGDQACLRLDWFSVSNTNQARSRRHFDLAAMTLSSGLVPEVPWPDGAFDVLGSVKACVTDADCAAGETGPAPQTVCRAGVCYVARNRFLSVETNPANAGTMYAYRVSLDTGPGGIVPLGFVQDPATVDVSGPGPNVYNLAQLDPVPAYRDWESPITIGDCEISPGHLYVVQAIASGEDTANEANYSAPLLLPTVAQHADVTGGGTVGDPPNGSTTLVDVFSIVLGFQQAQNEPKDWLDLEPNTGPAIPNMVVSLADAFAGVQGFQLVPYPGPAPLDCP